MITLSQVRPLDASCRRDKKHYRSLARRSINVDGVRRRGDSNQLSFASSDGLKEDRSITILLHVGHTILLRIKQVILAAARITLDAPCIF